MMYSVLLVLALTGLVASILPVHAQEEFLCPKQYEAHNRKITLQDQQITKSPIISKAVCSYFEQNTSKTTFEIRWSPTGNLHTGEWCIDRLIMESGIGKYKSGSHYVEISSTGILPSEYDDAKNFMQLLFVIVKDDAKSCHVMENFTDEKSQQTKIKSNTEVNIESIKENKTIKEQPQQSMIESEESENQFPLIGIIAGSAIAVIGFIAIKRYKSRQ